MSAERSAPRAMIRRYDERVGELPDGAAITTLERWVRDPNLVRLVVDGREVARLTDRMVEAIGLAVADPWTADLAERVRATLVRDAAHRAALVALGRRPMTRREVRDALVRRGHEDDLAELVADELAAEGWIDDTACAESICRTVLAKGPAAPTLLVNRMIRRGIAPDLAEATARDALPATDQVEAAVLLARREIDRARDAPPAKTLRRVASSLARRGYDEEVIESVVHHLGLDGGPEDLPADR